MEVNKLAVVKENSVLKMINIQMSSTKVKMNATMTMNITTRKMKNAQTAKWVG